MTKVFQWAADFAGCWTYRMKFPAEIIRTGPNTDEFTIESDMKIAPKWMVEADTIVGQRVCKDGPSTLWQKWAKEGSKRLVFEMDDDLFNVDPSNVKAYEVFNKPSIRANLIRNIQVADTVTVSTEPLRDIVVKLTGHTDVRVIPNAIPTWVLSHEAASNHTTGYMGSPTHHKDLKAVSRHLKRFHSNNPEATFHSIGYDYGSYVGIAPHQRSHTPWIRDVEQAIGTLDFEFGVAPLVSSMFNRSKSSLKFLELAALGRPCVVSGVAAYNEVQDGVTGLVAKYEHEWPKKLQAMYEDTDMRRELGRAAKEYVAGARTMEHVRELWEDAYRG